MDNEYKVVGKFLSPAQISGEMVKMVVVQDDRGACIKPETEWNEIMAGNIEIGGKKNDSAA